MARIRTIKPELWRNEKLSELPEATHMLAAALLTYSDDEGYFNANPKLIQAECCPLREPTVSVSDSLIHLERIGFIEIGTATDGRRYGRVVKFTEHQRVSHPTDSKIKVLDVAWGSLPKNSGSLPKSSALNREQGTGKGREQGKEGNREHDNALSREFVETFWPVYPRKQAKPAALRAFKKARKAASLQTIMDGVRRLSEEGREKRFIPHASKWLNNEQWNDELMPRQNGTGPPKKRSPSLDYLDKKLAESEHHEPTDNGAIDGEFERIG